MKLFIIKVCPIVDDSILWNKVIRSYHLLFDNVKDADECAKDLINTITEAYYIIGN